MARIGLGFPAGRRRTSGETTLQTNVTLAPGATWNGISGSGFSALPSDPPRTSAKPAIRIIVPPNQHFTDELWVGFAAWANDNGSMLANNGLKCVRVHFEGNELDLLHPSLRSFNDANGQVVAYRAWWVRLKRPQASAGEVHLYAEAIPADLSMQNRVVGPFHFTLTEQLHDFIASVDPDNVGGSVYADINNALTAAALAGAQNPRILVKKTGVYSVAGAVVGSPYFGSGYATIEADSGVTATIGYEGDQTGNMRSKYGRLRFRGAGIVFDMDSVEVLHAEPDSNHWLDGCSFYRENGNQKLWNGTLPAVAFSVSNNAWFTEVDFNGVNSPLANANLARGCIARNCYNDFAAQPFCLIGNTVLAHDNSFFRSYLPALTLGYTGSGAATLSAVDGGSGLGKYRRFTFKVDGSVISTYDSLTLNTRGASGTYTIGDLVSFINNEAALSDWSAVLLDDTRYAGHLGVSNGFGFPFADESVLPSGTTFETFIDLHSDFSQFPSFAGTENIIVEGNKAIDFDGQIIWVSSSGPVNDVFYVNNIFNAKDSDPNGFSQIGRTGEKSHLVIAHNTLTQQLLTIRDVELGTYSLLANNVAPDISDQVGSVEPGRIVDNHIYSSGSVISGSSGTVVTGDESTLFENAGAEDFNPAGELRSSTKRPIVRYDLSGTLRANLDAVGAISINFAEPVTTLNSLSLAQDKVAENTPIGTLVSTVFGATQGSTIKLTNNASNRFAKSEGNLVVGSTPIDFESGQSHQITLTETLASAGNSPRETHFLITVVNVLETNLSALSLSANLVSETASAGDVVGTLNDVSEGAILSLVDDAGGKFALSNNSVVVGPNSIDFETSPSHTIIVRETHVDALNGPRDTILSISVANAQEAFLNELTLSSNVIAEDAQPGHEVGEFNNATLGSTLSLVDDAEGRFSLAGTNLIIGDVPLDYEAQNTHQITIRETFEEAINSPRESVLTISVTNVGEIPLGALSLTAAHIAEHSSQGSFVGSVLGKTDGSSIELIDSANDRFALQGNDLVTGSTGLKFEEGSTYQITLEENWEEASNGPRQTTLAITLEEIIQAPSAKDELIAALASSPQSAFSDFRTATDNGDWYSQDLSGQDNDFSQTIASLKPGIDPDLGALFSATTARELVGFPITGGTFTVLLALVKDQSDERGNVVSDGSNSPGRYQSASGLGLQGVCLVDGSQVMNAGQLHNALTDGLEHVIEWQGIDANGWANLSIGRASDSIGGSVRCAVVIDEGTVPDLIAAREAARAWAASADKVTILPEEPQNSISYQSTLSGGRDAEAAIDPGYWDEVADREAALDLDIGEKTHRSVRDGNWSSSSTWDTGVVPGANAIVEVAHEVVYDTSTPIGASDTGELLAAIETDDAAAHALFKPYALKGVIVNTGGRLRFDPSVQTFLLTENLFALPDGEIEIGNVGNPVLDSGITNNGHRVPRTAIGLIGLEDPGSSARLGMVTMGRLRLCGESKTVAAFANDLAPGDTDIVLNDAPIAWRVGDRVLIAGTNFTERQTTDDRFTGPVSYWGPEDAEPDDQASEWIGRQYTSAHFKVSTQDEIRTIAAINGSAITLDQPLDFAHRNVSDQLYNGEPTSLRFPIQNLSRSICIFGFCTSERGSEANQRAHTMHLFHDDCVRQFAEFKDLGRSRIDASLYIDGENDLDKGLRTAQGGTLLAEQGNVTGRYAVFDSFIGPFIGRRAVISEGLSIHNKPGTVSPGRGYVQQHSRAHLRSCVVHGFRATGISALSSSDIGQWESCYASNCPGDGFLPSSSGDRHDLVSGMSGHQGAAFHSDAPQVLITECWAGSANTAFSLRQTRAKLANLHKIDARNLRQGDPLAGAALDKNASKNSFPQMPHFDFNTCHDCEEGFHASRAKAADDLSIQPTTSEGVKLHARLPISIAGYASNLLFKDFLLTGSGSAPAIEIRATSSNNSFANGRVVDCASVIRDAGLNYHGFLIDIVHNCPQLQEMVGIELDANAVATHQQTGIMGPWSAIEQDTETATVNVREYSILDGSNGLPSALPSAAFNPGPAMGIAIPRFELAPGSGGTITPDGFGQISVRGIITDRAGNRDWPSVQRLNPASADPIGGRTSDSLTGQQIVERHGCWNDNGTWRSTLWFVDADRVEHTPILIDVTCELVGFEESFLALNEVANANATKPFGRLTIEDASWSSAPSIETDVAPIVFLSSENAAPGSLVVSPNSVRIGRLSAHRNVAASIDGGALRVNGSDWTTDRVTARRGDTIEVRARSSLDPGTSAAARVVVGSQTADFTVTTWDIVSNIADSFDEIANGTALEMADDYELLVGTGGAMRIEEGSLAVKPQSEWVQHAGNLACVDRLRFKARWGNGGGVRFGLADPTNPIGCHFMIGRRWDGSVCIEIPGNTWVYPDCGTQEVSVELVDGRWTVFYDGVDRAICKSGPEILPEPPPENSRVCLASSKSDGARKDTLREFVVEHI